MSQKIYSDLDVKGSVTISTINSATTDTDKFLVSDGGVVKYRTGAEMLSDLGVATGVASNIQHQVKAGVAINKGQAVYVTGADGTNMIVGLASNATEATSSKTMGLMTSTVAINDFGNVVAEGLLAGLNTLAATAGDPVWLGTGGNLIYGLINKPYAPAHLVFIGIVTRVNLNNGEIFVKVQNGFELNEIHDVDLKTTTPVDGHILGFNGTLWVNKTIAGWLGYTPANANGTANYISKFTGTNTLGNSLIYETGNFISIGGTAASAKLDVQGNIFTRNLLYFGQLAGSAIPDWSLGVNSSADLIVDDVISTRNFVFSNAGNVFINNAGQVTIGTTDVGTPSYGSLPQLTVANASGGVLDIRTTNTNVVANTSLGRIQFTGKDDNTVGYTSAAIEAISAGTSNSGTNGGGILKLMTAVNSTGSFPSERVRIDSFGNVGIGTTTPTAKLHSVSSGYGPTTYESRSAIFGNNISTDIFYNNQIGVAGRVQTSGGRAIYGDASSGSGWGGYFDGKGYFSDSVGIGTITLTEKLTVSGYTIATGYKIPSGIGLNVLLDDGNTTPLSNLTSHWTKTGDNIQNNNIGHTQVKILSGKQLQFLNSANTLNGYIDESGTARFGNTSTVNMLATIGPMGGNAALKLERTQASSTMIIGNPQISQAFSIISTNYFGSSYVAGSNEVSASAGAEHSFNIGNAVGDGITSGIFRIGRTRLQSTVPVKYGSDLSASYDDRTLVDKGYITTSLSAYSLDSNVVHKTGDETITGVKTFNGTLNTTTAYFNLAAITNSPTGGVPDSIQSWVHGHNGVSPSSVSCFYGLMDGNKNVGACIQNLDTFPDATNSTGFEVRFKSTSTTNTAYRSLLGGVETFTVSDSGNGFFYGNLGIGETNLATPVYGLASKLMVADSQSSILTIKNKNGSSPGSEIGQIQFMVGGDYVSGAIKATSVSTSGSGNSGGADIKVFTTIGYGAPQERFKVSNDGSVVVGISTQTTPSFGSFPLLSVASTVGTSVLELKNNSDLVTAGSEIGQIQFSVYSASSGTYTSSAIKSFSTGAPSGGASGGGYLSFFTSTGITGASPQERIRIGADGNIGVNTTIPTARLHVKNGGVTISSVTFFSDNFARSAVTPGGNPLVNYAGLVGQVVIQSVNLNPYALALTAASTYNNISATYPSFPTNNYSTTLNANSTTLQWAVNTRQTANIVMTGFGAGQVGQAVILACNSGAPYAAGSNGYALVFGNLGTNQWSLCHFTNGLNANGNITNLITSPNTGADSKCFYSIRVTYTPATGLWALYLRSDGCVAISTVWGDPRTTSTSIGTATNTTYTNTPLPYFGFVYNAGLGNGQFSNFSFINLNAVTYTDALKVEAGNTRQVGGFQVLENLETVNAANDFAAASLNVPLYGVYRNGSNLKIRTGSEATNDARPYKVYTALLSQSGTSAPTATVLENTLGGTLVWTRTGVGGYDGTLTGVFPDANKAFCIFGIGQTMTNYGDNINLFWQVVSNNAINLVTVKTNTNQDSVLVKNPIEIRVYN